MAIKKLPSTGDAPRSTGVPASLEPGGSADSAGYPWAGRTFDHHDTAFTQDDGSAPVVFRNAIRVLRAEAERYSGEAEPDDLAIGRLAAAHSTAILALSESRLLIPLLAEAGEIGVTPEGRMVEKTQELSIVTVAAPDGRRVMPVFTSVETMNVWNPHARPIPVPAPQVAIAAAQEITDLIIVDPASPEFDFGVRRTQLEALALSKTVKPAWADAEVLDAFSRTTANELNVLKIRLEPGDPAARLLTPETDVVLTLLPGLQRDVVEELIAALQRQWASESTIAERVDSLRLVVR